MTRVVDSSYDYSGKYEKFQLQYFASTFKFLLRMVTDHSLSTNSSKDELFFLESSNFIIHQTTMVHPQIRAVIKL